MVHGNARLTPLGRWLLVERVEVGGWPVGVAAESMGVSRETAYRWLRRFRTEGRAGLEDRSSRPQRSPRRTPTHIEDQVCALRCSRRWGPHRIGWALGMPRSTVERVLRRRGLSRLDILDRPTGRVVRRYERCSPGELIHIDVKRLGRIPDGGGWWAHGRAVRPNRKRGPGWDFVHVAVDDHSRVAYLEVHPDELGVTCAAFLDRTVSWFADHGVTVERVMTDNARNCRISTAFQDTLTCHQIRHLLTRPYRPQTNGKAERFNQTLAQEWAYATVWQDNQQRTSSLPRWLHDYNWHRPHTAVGGPPATRLPNNNLCGNDS